MFRQILEIEFATFDKYYFINEKGDVYSLLSEVQNNLVGGEFTTVILKDVQSNFFHSLPIAPVACESDTITGSLEDYGVKITKELMALEVASSLITGNDIESSNHYIESALELLKEKKIQVSPVDLENLLQEKLEKRFPQMFEATMPYSAYTHFEYRKIKGNPDEATAIEKVFNKEYLYRNAKEILNKNPYLLISFTTQIPKSVEQIDLIEQLPESIRTDKKTMLILVSQQPSVLFSSQVPTWEKIEMVTDKEIVKDSLFLEKLEKLVDSPKNRDGLIENLMELVTQESRKNQNKKTSINIAS